MAANERGFFAKVGIEAGDYSFAGSSAKAGFAIVTVHVALAWAECAARHGFYCFFDPVTKSLLAQL